MRMELTETFSKKFGEGGYDVLMKPLAFDLSKVHLDWALGKARMDPDNEG